VNSEVTVQKFTINFYTTYSASSALQHSNPFWNASATNNGDGYANIAVLPQKLAAMQRPLNDRKMNFYSPFHSLPILKIW